jgi:hypothetical protein
MVARWRTTSAAGLWQSPSGKWWIPDKPPEPPRRPDRDNKPGSETTTFRLFPARRSYAARRRLVIVRSINSAVSAGQRWMSS